MTRSRLIGALFFVCLATQISNCALQAQTRENPDLGKIRVQLKWLHQFQFAGYYAAVEKGYYAERGLDVELIEGRPELDPVDVVTAGVAEYGIATPELLLDYAAGEPVVALGVIFQHSPYVFLTTKESGITDITQMAGKRVMIEPQAAELYAYLKRERVPADSLTILPHSFSANDLINGTTDVMSAYSTDEEYTLEKDQIPYSEFTPRSAGVDFYGDLFFTSQEELEKHPERVEAFYEATVQGWQYALQHPEEIIDLILKKYPTKKSREALAFEAKQMRSLMHPELIPVGYMYEGRWHHIADTYRDLGMLDRVVPLGDFLYNVAPKPKYTWALWTTGITLTAVLIALAILLPMWRLNQKLSKEIIQRRETENQLYEAKAAAERANQFKAQFVTNVTHDLRTPLNAIMGLSDVMLDHESDAEKREHLDTIKRAGGSLLHLVDELLDLNRIESGRIDLLDKPFLLDDVLDDVASLMSVPAQRKGLQLTSWLEPDVPATVRGDEERLRQILMNLVGNAVKFTEQGSVSLSAAKGENGWLEFRIQDTGPGIPADIAPHLFEPFVRAKDARRKEGTGLGLSIVRRLAEAMGGTVRVCESSTKGTRFLVRLPILDDVQIPEALELSTMLAGKNIGVQLKTDEQSKAVLFNLEALGANATSFDIKEVPDYHLVVLDSSHSNPYQKSKLEAEGVLVVEINPLRSLQTRRTLARLIRAKLGLPTKPKGNLA